jgi:DNA-binding response OmpR family regulator
MAKKILVIDDDPVFVHLLQSSLKKAGYDVLVALDGINGYHMARNVKPDLIILDILMPVLNGYSVCGFLKMHKECYKIPIILISTQQVHLKTDFDDETRPEGYFTKPINTDEVLRKVQELIGS